VPPEIGVYRASAGEIQTGMGDGLRKVALERAFAAGDFTGYFHHANFLKKPDFSAIFPIIRLAVLLASDSVFLLT
jgi:hypothetical protein